MYQSELDIKIISSVKNLNGDQKSDVLEYLKSLPKKVHSTKLYRRKALKQIRQALNNEGF